MSTVLFKRGDMATMNATTITDGMVFFNEENNRIYMDNGSTRYQYGGDTELISNASSATVNNAFNANASINLFAQKTTVVDDAKTALNVTQNYIPLGCLAFKEALGINDYSTIGDGSLSGAILALRGNVSTGTLLTGNTTLVLNVPTLNANSFVDYYTSVYKAMPTDSVSDYSNHTLTLTFDAQAVDVTVKVIVRNL